jgi:hypothetical protein
MGMVRRYAVLAVVAATALGVSPGLAHAQAGADKQAQALFDEGQKLMAERRYAEACDRFAQSDRVQPSGSAVANLADCLEKQGLTASAWRRFKDAQARAARENKADIAKYLADRIAQLEPKLSRVTVAPSEKDAGIVAVTLDGAELPRSDWRDAPVDPGPHVVQVAAAGKSAFTKSIDVGRNGARVTIDVPPLEDAPAATPTQPAPAPVPPTPPSPEREPPSSWSTQKTLALVAAGVGVAGVAAGSVLGLQAKSKNDDALSSGCSGSTCPTQAGVDASSNAANAGTLSTIFFAAGGAALAGGVVLWLTAPSPSASSSALRVTPHLGAQSAGLVVGGGW